MWYFYKILAFHNSWLYISSQSRIKVLSTYLGIWSYIYLRIKIYSLGTSLEIIGTSKSDWSKSRSDFINGLALLSNIWLLLCYICWLQRSLWHMTDAVARYKKGLCIVWRLKNEIPNGFFFKIWLQSPGFPFPEIFSRSAQATVQCCEDLKRWYYSFVTVFLTAMTLSRSK